MSKYKIFVDLDGVLVNFGEGYKKLTGVDLGNKYVKFNASHWAPIDREGPTFWVNLNWMNDGKILWNYVRKYSPNILSSPSRSSTSKVGKKTWCSINVPESDKILLYPREQKQKFSAENHILIDDLENTIEEWNNKGGIGILHVSADQTIKELKKIGI
jgi:hypothetical protein